MSDSEEFLADLFPSRRRKLRTLQTIRLDRIDFVPVGAHPGAHIAIFKSEDRKENMTRNETQALKPEAEALRKDIESRTEAATRGEGWQAKLAKAAQRRLDAGLERTVAQARVAAMHSDPDLQARYLAERDNEPTLAEREREARKAAEREVPAWEAKLNERARERLAKAQSPTIEQARVAVMESDPELRREYVAER